jgi:transposase-like protein
MSRKAYSMRRRRFCGQEGVSEAAFYSWRKKLACGDSGQEIPPSDFLEVTVPAVESAALEVELPCGSVIRVSHYVLCMR